MNLEELSFAPELSEGARNAIFTCLRLQPSEHITLITDEATAEIAAAILQQIKEAGAHYHVFVLEEFAARPLNAMPEPVLQELRRSDASIYAAQAQQGELKIRMQMMEIINQRRIRHGHMVNIDKRIMLEGMRADYQRIDELSQTLIEKARRTRVMRAKSPAGTDITVEFSPRLKWVKTSGIISPDKWGNLPGGEIFTSPADLNGMFVVDGVVGNYLCQKYGDLQHRPLAIEIRQSRIKSLACRDPQLVEEFRQYTSTDENSDRVGEFAIGTNLAVRDIIGNILQDEKMPGIHIAFGHPYSEHTGQNWTSSTHIDCVGRRFDIWMDDDKIMENGKFIFKKS